MGQSWKFPCLLTHVIIISKVDPLVIPTLQIIKLSKEKFKNTQCYLIWFELKTSDSRAHRFNHCSSRYCDPSSTQDTSVASASGSDEGEGWSRGFVVFFSLALFFASSYKQVPFFHQVITWKTQLLT